VTPNEVLTLGSLRNMAGMTPLAHVLRLCDPESFFLPRSPKPSSGDLWSLWLPTKHGGASFTLCDSITNSGSQLEVAFAWRWKLAPNSSPSNTRFNPDESNLWSLTSSLPKVWPSRIGVETERHSLLLLLFAKRLACDITVELVMVIPLTFVRSITTPGYTMILRVYLHGLWRCPLRCAALFSLTIWY
jgi:hypothetical protein